MTQVSQHRPPGAGRRSDDGVVAVVSKITRVSRPRVRPCASGWAPHRRLAKRSRPLCRSARAMWKHLGTVGIADATNGTEDVPGSGRGLPWSRLGASRCWPPSLDPGESGEVKQWRTARPRWRRITPICSWQGRTFTRSGSTVSAGDRSGTSDPRGGPGRSLTFRPTISGCMAATTHVAALDFDTDNGLDQVPGGPVPWSTSVRRDEPARCSPLVCPDRRVPAIAARCSAAWSRRRPSDDLHIEPDPSRHGQGGRSRPPCGCPGCRTPRPARRCHVRRRGHSPRSDDRRCPARHRVGRRRCLPGVGERWRRPPIEVPRNSARHAKTTTRTPPRRPTSCARCGVANAMPGRNARCPAHGR
jgi:hypothetical protein